MNTLVQLESFRNWLRQLKDARGKARILARLTRRRVRQFRRLQLGRRWCQRNANPFWPRIPGLLHEERSNGLSALAWRRQSLSEARHCEGKGIGTEHSKGYREMKKITKFDVADYLESDEIIAEYLDACLEDEDPDIFLAALANVAKAKGMSQIAEDAGLGRESLYKALAKGAHPRHETVRRVISALGLRLSISVNQS